MTVVNATKTRLVIEHGTTESFFSEMKIKIIQHIKCSPQLKQIIQAEEGSIATERGPPGCEPLVQPDPIAKGTRAARGAPAPQCIPLPCTSIAQLQSDDIVDLAGQRKQNLMKKPKKEIKQKFNAILGGLKDRQQIKMLSEYLDGFFDQQPDQQSLGCKRQRQAPPRASSSPSGGRSAPRARIVDAQRGQQRALPAQIPILGQVAMPVTSDQLSKAPPGTRFTCGDFPKTNMCLLEHAPGSRVRQLQWMKKAGGNLVQDKNFDLHEINIDEVHLDKFLGGLRVFGS